MRKSILFLCLFIASNLIIAQDQLLQSGPMVAYSTMKEVLLWAQTSKTAVVHFDYWDVKNPSERFRTDPVITQKSKVYIAHCIADQLEPSTDYQYELFINNEKVERSYPLEFQSQPLWLWRTDAPDFSFATGSCNYINEEKYDRLGKPYGAEFEIYEDIVRKKPDFMVWLGDNVYLREADWNSRTGIMHRYTHTRSHPKLQAMLGGMHHYGIWDDHDFGPNDSDRSYPLKGTTEEAFKLFYPNNNYVFDEGITGKFQWADCEFFMMDNRYWRTPNKRRDIKDKEILGEDQIEWLLDALVNSYAPFKFIVIGNQVVSPIEKYERHANIAPAERLRLLKKIEELKINGVVFLSGDVHHTELSALPMDGGYPLYDLTISPMTSGAYGQGAEENPTQQAGTLVKQRNYAVLKVFGSKEERALDIKVFSSKGEELWTKLIKAGELTFPKE